MPVPRLVPTSAQDAVVADVTYHIEGELVPVLALQLDRMPVFFEHHILLWKDPQMDIRLKPLAGAFKRMLAGMPIFMTEVLGPGNIAFSRDGAGHILPIHLAHGQAVDVREHQFIAATGNIDYSFQWVKGISNMLLGGTGLFIDTFASINGEGCVWLHGYGNVFEVSLGPGQAIDIEPGGWVYKDPSVSMQSMFQNLKTGIFGSSGAISWNRFTGPGRIGLQSMSPVTATADSNANPGGAGGGVAGALVGGVLKGLGG